jgi:hypothetical protein
MDAPGNGILPILGGESSRQRANVVLRRWEARASRVACVVHGKERR